MKAVKFLAAAALGLSALSAPAFALVTLADLQAGTSAVVVWHAGASASSQSVQEAAISSLCDQTDSVGKPINLYGNNAANTAADMWTVECTSIAVGTNIAAGSRIIYNKRDKGGSGVGTAPLFSQQLVGFMLPVSVAGGNCPVTETGSITVGGSIPNVHYYNCAGFVTGAAAAIHALSDPLLAATDDVVTVNLTYGTSDIEPGKFAYALNTPNVDLDLNGTNDAINPAYAGAGVTGQPMSYLVFNTPANLLMYQDLQRAQFPTGHPLFADCNPAGATYGLIGDLTANANKAKCLPSLSSAELRSIFMTSGAVRNIGDFQKETAYQSGVFAAMTGTGTTITAIHICRRGNGSGTQAQFNANILGYPCDDVGSWLTPETSGVLTAFVHNGSDATAVDNCLDDYSNGLNVSGFNAAAAKGWAIGIQSTEKNLALAKAYRYIAIDGAAPSLVNVHAGDYYDFAQQSLNTSVATPPTGAQLDVKNAMLSAFTNPTKVGNLGQDQPYGRAGWLADPSTSAPNLVTGTLVTTAPVTTFVKKSSTGVPNTCALPAAFKGAAPQRITVAPQNCSLDNGSLDQNCYQ
jgi:hypothetical protein